MSNIKFYKILISIPTDAVGLLIGKEGKTFNEISIQSNAKLSLQLHHDICKGSRERSVIIEGDVTSIAKAIKIILNKLSSRNLSGDLGSEKTELIKWVVSQSRCSMIIGRGGNGIKAIHASSGAWVKIAHVEEACPGEGQRLLYIRGTKSQNEVALNMVRQIAGGHPYDEGLAPKPVEQVNIDLNEGIPEFLDIMISVKATPHIAKDIPGVDVIVDPEYDVFVDKFFKLRVIGKTKESAIVAIDTLKNALSSWESMNKTSPNLTSIDDNQYIAFKIIVHTDHYTSLCEDIIDSNSSFTMKDLLYRDFNFYLLSLNSSIKFSQTFNARQCVIIGLRHTFMIRLEELIPLISKEADSASPGFNTIDQRRVTKNISPKNNNKFNNTNNNRSNEYQMQVPNTYAYIPQYMNGYQMQQSMYPQVIENNYIQQQQQQQQQQSYNGYNENRSASPLIHQQFNNNYSYGYSSQQMPIQVPTQIHVPSNHLSNQMGNQVSNQTIHQGTNNKINQGNTQGNNQGQNQSSKALNLGTSQILPPNVPKLPTKQLENESNQLGINTDIPEPPAPVQQSPYIPSHLYNTKVFTQTIPNNVKPSPLMNTTYMNPQQYGTTNDIPVSIYGQPPTLYPYLINPSTFYMGAGGGYPSPRFQSNSNTNSPPGSAKQRGRKRFNSKNFRPGLQNLSDDLRSRSSSTDSFAQLDSIYTVLTSVDTNDKINENSKETSEIKSVDVDSNHEGISASE